MDLLQYILQRIVESPGLRNINLILEKKVFASKKYPEIFGYAGDVLFPSIVLEQIIELIDAGVLLSKEMTCDD